MNMDLNAYLTVAGIIFSIGFFGVLLRRNALVMLMCLELMLNASNIALVAYSRYNATEQNQMMDGNTFVFFIITVAAAEVAVGLAIIVQLFRKTRTVMADELNTLRD